MPHPLEETAAERGIKTPEDFLGLVQSDASVVPWVSLGASLDALGGPVGNRVG